MLKSGMDVENFREILLKDVKIFKLFLMLRISRCAAFHFMSDGRHDA
jgi:hypothetical protein